MTTIKRSTFEKCSSLQSVTIPSNIKKIASLAFSDCHGLKAIILHDGVTSIGSSAFSDCSGIISITIPGSVTTIEGAAFQSCSNLMSVDIFDGVKTIGDYAFMYCRWLSTVTIPSSVKSIGDAAFAYCTNLSAIYCHNTNPCTIKKYTFNVSYDTATLYVPMGFAQAYKTAMFWKNFQNIIEFNTETSIADIVIENAIKVENGNVVIENAKGKISVYTLSGAMIQNVKANGESIRINVPAKGMYILKTSKGARKVAL